ncbi:MAG: class I SAM-dependent methyltransferase [Syntrophaceae bacterium]
MSLDRELRTIFNDVAEIYDEIRPGYPEQLIEDVLALSSIPSGGNILEIGCGTGKATIPFARRGYTILCLELSKNMARLTAKLCQPYPGVEVKNVSFEEWPLQEKAFDLVICAEAFHWISPNIKFVKAASSLKSGGSIALFWHGHHSGGSKFFQEAEELYRKKVPQLAEMRKKTPDELQRETIDEIEGSRLFSTMVVRRYPWREIYSAERYVKLVSTYSPIHRLEEDVRQSVLNDIRDLIGRHGGIVESEYISRLYVARVRT